MRVSPPTPGPGQTAALVLFANLGDLLLLEPCLRWLHHRGVALDLYCPREVAVVWEGDPRLRRIVPLRAGNRRYEPDAGDPRAPAIQDRYDFLFDFRPTGRSYRLAMSLRARHRCSWQGLGFRRLVHAFLYNVRLPPPTAPLRRDRYCLALMGIAGTAADPWLPARMAVDPGSLATFRNRSPFFQVPSGSANSRTLLIQPTARWKRKLWIVEGWRTLIARLQAVPGNRIGLVCGPDPQEISLLREIARDLLPAVSLFPGTLSWADLRSAIAASDLFIGLDSAPYHLAAMLDRPLVVLFGPTDEREWGPVHAHQRLVKAPLVDHQHLTANIPVSAVLDAVQSVAPRALPHVAS